MVNLLFDELRPIAQMRNISDYENKSKEDLTKALSEPKLEIPNLKHQKLKHQNQKNQNWIKQN